MSTSHQAPERTSLLLASSLALTLLFAASPAQAAFASAIPEECGSWSELQAELQSRLGPDAALDSTRVTLTPDDAGYRLVVEVGSERRELHDPNCRELMRAAVVIAIALLEPQREQPKQAEPVVVAARPREDRTPQASPLRVALAGGAGLHVGSLPNPTLLLDLDAQLLWARWGIAGGFRYLLPSSEHDARGRGARVGGVGGYVAGSYQPWSRLQGRLGFAAYRLSGAGLGSLERSSDAAWEVGPTLGAAFIPFRWQPFWTSVGAEGQLNLVRPVFKIDNYGEVFRVPWGSGSFFLRAGVIW